MLWAVKSPRSHWPQPSLLRSLGHSGCDGGGVVPRAGGHSLTEPPLLQRGPPEQLPEFSAKPLWRCSESTFRKPSLPTPSSRKETRRDHKSLAPWLLGRLEAIRLLPGVYELDRWSSKSCLGEEQLTITGHFVYRPGCHRPAFCH